MNEQFYTGTELAKILKVSKAYAYQLMRENKIRTIRFGRVVRVRESDLDDFVKRSIQGNGIEQDQTNQVLGDVIQFSPQVVKTIQVNGRT